MEQLTQGSGTVRTFTGTAPTENTDGTPYTHNPEDFFRFYLTSDPTLIPNPPDPVVQAELKRLFPPDNVELVNGEFSQGLSVDATPTGPWFVTFSTVNVVPVGDPFHAAAATNPFSVTLPNGDIELEGPVYPTPLQLEILAAPLAAPLYPSNIG